MLRRASLTALSLLAVLGASACAPGSDSPAPEQRSEPAPATSGAPQVENAKDLKAVANACELLAPDQVAALGGTAERQPPEESKSMYGETQCKWQTDAFNVNIAVNTTYGGVQQLDETAGSSEGSQRTEVAGYQGVRYDVQSDLCSVDVAVAGDQSLEIGYFKNAGGTPEMDDPCGFAEKIAGEALKNVPDA